MTMRESMTKREAEADARGEEIYWHNDPDEVHAYASFLFLGSTSVKDVLDYFEKPWKWDPEHEEWVAGGRPS